MTVRVPYPLVVLACLALMSGVWWARTRHMDFMVSSGKQKPLPSFIAPADEDDGSQHRPTPSPRPATSDGGGKQEKPDPLGLGDLESAPGLAEYSELSSLGAAHIIKAATELENLGNFQRAHLAWERVLDSCQPSPEERNTASAAIQRIRPTLPRWNIDPSGEFPILLQLGTTRNGDETISPVATKVAEFLRRESSDQISFVPRITTSRVRGTPKQSPIAVYFSGTGDGEETQSGLASVNPSVGDSEALQREMLSAIYGLIEKRVAGLDTLTPPGPATHPEAPKMDFQRQLTRLHWQYFARSLAQTPSAPTTVQLPDAEGDDGED